MNIFKKFIRPPLYAIGAYSVYAATTIVQIRSEIGRREELELPDQQRFAPIKLWGVYHNPFLDYDYETLFRFVHHNFGKAVAKSVGKLPSFAPSFDTLNSDNGKIEVTWLGQSCCLLRAKNTVILTDPVFEPHLFSSHFGPRRIVPIPAKLSELPEPDIVLISHNHPDHFEPNTIRKLGRSRAHWVVPRGLAKRLMRLGVAREKIAELDWWEKKEITKGWSVLLCGSMHWSGRWGPDFNRSLWGSPLLYHGSKPMIFHIGDSGYSAQLYGAISRIVCDPISLILAPIGPGDVPHHHMGPQDAVKLSTLLRAKNLLGVHYGTYGGEKSCDLLRAAIAGPGTAAADLGKTITFEI